MIYIVVVDGNFFFRVVVYVVVVDGRCNRFFDVVIFRFVVYVEEIFCCVVGFDLSSIIRKIFKVGLRVSGEVFVV